LPSKVIHARAPSRIYGDLEENAPVYGSQKIHLLFSFELMDKIDISLWFIFIGLVGSYAGPHNFCARDRGKNSIIIKMRSDLISICDVRTESLVPLRSMIQRFLWLQRVRQRPE